MVDTLPQSEQPSCFSLLRIFYKPCVTYDLFNDRQLCTYLLLVPLKYMSIKIHGQVYVCVLLHLSRSSREAWKEGTSIYEIS